MIIIIISFISFTSFAVMTLYTTKEYDRSINFDSDGPMENKYNVQRVDSGINGTMNVSYEADHDYADIDFVNIRNISIDLTELCDQKSELMFDLGENSVGPEYCFFYLSDSDDFYIDLTTTDLINFTFIDVPQPILIKVDGISLTPGNFSEGPFNGNWTYDDDNQILYVQMFAGQYDFEIQFTEYVSPLSGIFNLIVDITPAILLIHITRILGTSLIQDINKRGPRV